jgi:aspartate/methionine/tyrosine aminotransferase
VTSPMNPHLNHTTPPPVMAARDWLRGMDFSADKPLLNVSQAAPVEAPPLPLRQFMADTVLNDAETHIYGPVLGRPDLRQEVADQWTKAYQGRIAAGQVAITSGCNQAFCAAVSTLAGAGDAIIIPTPWYFNHKMWLDMQGITALCLPCGTDMLPDPEQARSLITPAVKAILLVTPNNPSGAEYPAALMQAFLDLARHHNLALIVDETYRDFDSRDGAPHALFTDPDWSDTLIQLYSFSKAYRLTGHRVGTLIASTARLAQAEKFLDTMTICPNQLGQRAALYGLRNLGGWLAGERLEILRRRDAMVAGFANLDGWTLKGCGAYFAYAQHPFEMPSDTLARKLVSDQAVLTLPGTMFAPVRAQGGDGTPEQHLRIAFANVDQSGISTLFARLGACTG